jgi:hypothetical protein
MGKNEDLRVGETDDVRDVEDQREDNDWSESAQLFVYQHSSDALNVAGHTRS